MAALIAVGCAGTAWAADPDLAEKPQVSLSAATEVTMVSATLNGEVDPNGHGTDWQFEYGPTASYGSTTTTEQLSGGDDEPIRVSVTLADLQPGLTYHFRLVAKNSKGTTRSNDAKFTTVAPPPPPPGDPTGDPAPGEPGYTAPADAPDLGRSVVVAPAAGELFVRRPGAKSFSPLAFGDELPLGSEIDARRGSIVLTSALPNDKVQSGRFGGGRFVIRQGRRAYVDLHLRGRACLSADARSASHGTGVTAVTARRRKAPRLWGRDHGGRFRTHGRNSHATVRGTRWMVAETCRGTLTRVSRGAVVVKDIVRDKRILVKAGQSYLARPRR